jgi:hypothetical protein
MERQRRRGRRTTVVAVVAVALTVGAGSVVVPVQAAFGATEPTASTATSPLTASGCNQNVCIYVVGSGTQVTKWETTAVLPTAMCTVAKYWANGVLVYEGTIKCGSAGGSVMSYWTRPGYFAAGTQVCNTWANVQGRPCETIE